MACSKVLFLYLYNSVWSLGVHALQTGTAPAPAPAPEGPYETKLETFSDHRFDWSNTHIDVIYPVTKDNKTFPLISYAHGFSNTADGDYDSLFRTLASWGYVVVAPKTCRYGCFSWWNCKNLPGDPVCYGDYYKMQLLAIDWARERSAVGKLPINFAVGVGVAGHSMGGQATLYSAAMGADSHDIRAAVLQHPFTHTYPSIKNVPFLVFTSTNDTLATPNMSQQIFHNASVPERGLVERVDDPADPEPHLEPKEEGFHNSGIKWFTVAWFKVHLDKTPKAEYMINGRKVPIDFEELLYGRGAASLCHGGDGPLRNCSLLRSANTADSYGKTIIV